MDCKRLKLGFIGGALNSAVGYAHFCACKLDNRFEVAAGCFSTDASAAMQTSQAYGVCQNRTYTDWKKMLQEESGKIDAVVVLTPTPIHYEVVMEALRLNIPVICEKSLTMNSVEAKDIAELVEKQKGFLAVTYNYTGYPIVRELRSIIKSGKLGEILHFQAQMPQEGFIRTAKDGKKPKPQQWRLEDKTIPTIYLDLCSHLHEIIYYLIGEKPVSVISNQASDGWFKDVVDNVSCLCKYGKNIQGQLWFSKSAIGYRNGLSISIFGSKGSATWTQTNPEEVVLAFANGTKQILDRASDSIRIADEQRYSRFKAGHPAGFIEAFANVYTDIHKALVDYKEKGKWSSKEIFSTEFAIEGLVMLEAMVKSSHTKTWEKVQ